MPDILLKNGSLTRDRRLDRVIEFDERSRDFPIRAIVDQRPPRSYTWNFWPEFDSGPFDQGSEGSCVGFAWTHECGIRPLATLKDPAFAREQVYWEAQKIDFWPGGAYPGADPFYEGTSILAGAKVMHKAGFFREYRWAFGLQDLIQAVSYHGPAVLGVNWHFEMYFPDHNGFIRPRGPVFGGHAIVCAGIDVGGKFFKVINSWGPGWGRPQGEALLPGWCRISFSDMSKLLQDNGEACIPSVRRSSDFA